MDLSTNLQGRVRNTWLPVSHGLLTVFEAVVNSIHAVDEADVPTQSGRIRGRVDRAPAQQTLELRNDAGHPEVTTNGEVTGFTVTDNGVRFNDEYFHTFATLDTDHKAAKGSDYSTRRRCRRWSRCSAPRARSPRACGSPVPLPDC
jgi:hypothetical protein